jgi:hypothetical protein
LSHGISDVRAAPTAGAVPDGGRILLGARRQWKRTHGGSIIVTVAIAFMFGAWTCSQVLLWGLVAFAVMVTLIARRRP